ncbi:prostaglandin G/H synthase 2 isoform X2 [Brachyhypopomus gauderio]|uniref:prostaglandin G/H synthase 2 isoform X2 n=1 Tax=Brachyhypopomus gauderio TaxID=698409 RepID=UPI004040FAD2
MTNPPACLSVRRGYGELGNTPSAPHRRTKVHQLTVSGKKELPDVNVMAEKLLLRRTFIPDPQQTSLMFAFFAQHFTHQFFKTDMKKGPAFIRAKNHGVDLSHIYGEELERQHKLRLFKDGKLKHQVLDGEVYPPTVSDAQVDMHYPPHVPESHRFAVGHEAFGLVPGLLMYATLWLREHNRVCDVLKTEHPDWDDERLFQTTRLILIGETIKIVIEDYVQHLSGYHFKLKFDPEILFNQRFQYQNRISSEFNTLYHWHPLMPDGFHIQDEVYNYSQFLFNTTLLTDYGISNLVESFTNQIAGRVAGGRNVGRAVLMVAVKSIENSRLMRFQSLNAYRKRFNMKPYVSFEDLTGEKEMAAELEEMYGHVDAVELYPGLLVEKPRPNGIFGETMVEMGAPYSLKGLLGNPICSPEYWKPSTFGGAVGFNIVNTASLQKLVCNNVKGPCPVASFHVPKVRDSVLSTINASTAHSSQKEVNPTVLLKDRSSEL